MCARRQGRSRCWGPTILKETSARLLVIIHARRVRRRNGSERIAGRANSCPIEEHPAIDRCYFSLVCDILHAPRYRIQSCQIPASEDSLFGHEGDLQMQESLRRSHSRRQVVSERLSDNGHHRHAERKRCRFHATHREADPWRLDTDCHGIHATQLLYEILSCRFDNLHPGQENRTDLRPTCSRLFRHRHLLRLLQAVLHPARHPRPVRAVREPPVRPLLRRHLGLAGEDLRPRTGQRGRGERRQENKLMRTLRIKIETNECVRVRVVCRFLYFVHILVPLFFV